MEAIVFGCVVGFVVYKLAVKFGWGGQPYSGGGSSSDGFWDTFGD